MCLYIRGVALLISPEALSDEVRFRSPFADYTGPAMRAMQAPMDESPLPSARA
jgi:hypothetical protein